MEFHWHCFTGLQTKLANEWQIQMPVMHSICTIILNWDAYILATCMSKGQTCQRLGNGTAWSVGGSVWQTNVPALPLWGPKMGRAVMLRELAKDEEVTLFGSQLCQSLRDFFPFTTLSLISFTIAPFITLSFSSPQVPLSLIVLGTLVPGSLMPPPRHPPPLYAALGFIPASLFSNNLSHIFTQVSIFSPSSSSLYRLNFFSFESF